VRPIQHGERERERKRSSPRGGEGSLLNRRRRKWGGGSWWACLRGGWRRRERKGALARWSAVRGSRQWPPAIGRGRRRCRANRGGRQAWATRAKGCGQLTRGIRVRWGTQCQRRSVGESERERPGGAVQTGIETNSEFQCLKQISNCFKLWLIRKVLS
jgi:hypothetical protein